MEIHELSPDGTEICEAVPDEALEARTSRNLMQQFLLSSILGNDVLVVIKIL